MELTYESLNQGDVFILDDGKTIYCWNGTDSTKRERVKAAEIARKIKDEERGGKAKIILIDADRDNDVHFFTALGGLYPFSKKMGGCNIIFASREIRTREGANLGLLY